METAKRLLDDSRLESAKLSRVLVAKARKLDAVRKEVSRQGLRKNCNEPRRNLSQAKVDLFLTIVSVRARAAFLLIFPRFSRGSIGTKDVYEGAVGKFSITGQGLSGLHSATLLVRGNYR